MKIVVLDGYVQNPGDLSWDRLDALGDLTVYERTNRGDKEEIIQRISDAEIVITNKTPLTWEIFDACPCMKYIGVFATGYDIVDVSAAKARGILVTNVPDYATNAVAQFTISLLLEICHHVGHHSDAVHKGRWTNSDDWCFWDYTLIELTGKRMGIIGYGRIGQTVGRIARAFGMKVLAYDVNRMAILESEECRYVELDELYEKSDIITLHCPLYSETEGIINKEAIAKMKPGVIILNNSRGQLIVEKDLAEALNSRKVFAAGLDVMRTEPVEQNNPLLKAKNCFITPHISWAPKESRQRLLDTVVENVKAYIDRSPKNVVNP